LKIQKSLYLAKKVLSVAHIKEKSGKNLLFVSMSILLILGLSDGVSTSFLTKTGGKWF